MLHRTPKLTPFGRRLLVERILIEGRAPATAAETLGVSRATAYKWLRRYRAEGVAGLVDRQRDRSTGRARWPSATCAASCAYACAVGYGSVRTASDRC